jgi:hypothetical protein
MPFISSVRGSYGPQGRFGRAIGLDASTGGTITTAGGYRIHTFTSTGTTSFVASGPGTVEYLVIAGGGSPEFYPNGAHGGGGAGGYLTGSTAVTAQSYSVTVGAGVINENGQNSSFGPITATGGGRGRGFQPGTPGGSGGGGGHDLVSATIATGTPGQGNNGGRAVTAGWGTSGGGGGAGAAGSDASPGSSGVGGPGGAGLSSSITGSPVARGGGGGGAGNGGGPNVAGGNGGTGGGGTSNPQGQPGQPGTTNTGGGAGGGPHDGGPAGKPGGIGGPGIVVIRYTV